MRLRLNYIRSNLFRCLRLSGRSCSQLKSAGTGGDDQSKNNYIEVLHGCPNKQTNDATCSRGAGNLTLYCQELQIVYRWSVHYCITPLLQTIYYY